MDTQSSAPDAKNGTHSSLLKKLALILAIVSSVVYLNTLGNGYVLDDNMMLADNAYVKDGFKGIPKLLTTPHLKGYMDGLTGTYRPLSLVVFAIEYQFFGATPLITHLFSVLTFAAAVLLLFLFLHRLFKEQRIALAFMTALLFAVHPIHTEVVANIKSRDELLCFMFAFLALNVFIGYARSGKKALVVLGALFMFLSIIAKETSATFVFVVPCIFFFLENEHKKRSLIITATTIATVVLFIGIRAIIISKYSAEGTVALDLFDNQLVAAPDFTTRAATAILILGDYLKLAFVPYRLVCDYSYCTIPLVGFNNIGVIVSGLVYLTLAGIAIYLLLKTKRSLWAFGILFYLFTMTMFSNIVFLVGATQADRFLFFASVGSCLLIALVIERWIIKDNSINGLKTSGGALLFGICIVFSVMTIARNKDWKDDYTLYTADLDKMPNNARLYNFVGMELQKKCELETNPQEKDRLNKECIAHLQRAIAIYPLYAGAHAELGTAFLIRGEHDSAIVHLVRSIELEPRKPQAFTNLATLYMMRNEHASAAYYFRRATEVEDTDVVSWFNLGICYSHIPKNDSAIYAFQKVISLNPSFNSYMSYANLAAVYNNMQQPDSAQKYAAIARQYAPQGR